MDGWTALEARIQENLAKAPNMVRLDVGGTIFKATKRSLLRVEGSYFHALLGSGLWQPDRPGDTYSLDLDPDIFRHVLNFLRTGKMFKGGPIKHRLDEVRAMTEYLNLDMGDCWNQWNPNTLPTTVSLYNDCRTIQCTRGDAVAFAMLPLGSIRIRLDQTGYRNVVVGAGTTTGPYAWQVRYSKLFHQKDFEWGRSVVTMRRRPLHVEIAMSGNPPFSIPIEDMAEDLYLAVKICYGVKLTILAN